MGIWTARHEALAHPALQDLHRVIETGLTLVDQGLLLLESQIHTNDLARINGVFLLKGKALLLSCYSLALDAHAQESGALLRPLLEVLELSKYLRTIPGAINQVRTDTLPTAGKRAQLIQGSFKMLRDYLNVQASHVTLSYEALRHLVALNEGRMRFRLTQQLLEDVACTNLKVVAGVLAMLLDETLLTVVDVMDGCPDHIVDARKTFLDRLNDLTTDNDS